MVSDGPTIYVSFLKLLYCFYLYVVHSLGLSDSRQISKCVQSNCLYYGIVWLSYLLKYVQKALYRWCPEKLLHLQAYSYSFEESFLFLSKRFRGRAAYSTGCEQNVCRRIIRKTTPQRWLWYYSEYPSMSALKLFVCRH